jgi:hypothetical protein
LKYNNSIQFNKLDKIEVLGLDFVVSREGMKQFC